jgi:hypothetical protein
VRYKGTNLNEIKTNKQTNIYFSNIKNRVRQGQLKVNLAANSEMLASYWDIGRMIYLQQLQKGWEKGVIPKLAVDLKNELSEVKGFSERNLKVMVQFFNEYKEVISIGQLPVAKLEADSIRKLPVSQLENDTILQLLVAKLETTNQQPITKMSWTHHIILIQKIKDLPIRYWYMQQILEEGWNRDTLVMACRDHSETPKVNTNRRFRAVRFAIRESRI